MITGHPPSLTDTTVNTENTVCKNIYIKALGDFDALGDMMPQPFPLCSP